MEQKTKKSKVENKEQKSSKFSVSKTKIEKRMKQKRDISLVETIIKLKKTNPIVAKELSKPKRRWPAVNLKEINMIDGDVLVVGKVLSAGDLENSRKIVAWSVSKKALEKIKDSKGTFISIVDEIKKNPGLDGYKIIK